MIAWKGWVAHPNAVLADAHVFVNTLAEEGFGMAMAEAMAFGLPVIAPKAGASPELVDDGVTGLLVAPESPAALADAIVAVLGDLDRAAEMGATARAKAWREYGTGHVAEATLAFYRQVLRAA